MVEFSPRFGGSCGDRGDYVSGPSRCGEECRLVGCEAWLEKDSVPYSRDFDKDPILVNGAEEGIMTCGFGCKFGDESSKKPDAGFGTPQSSGTAAVLRSMEAATYYPENNIGGTTVVGDMTL